MSRWSFSLRVAGAGELFENTRFPNRDGLFFEDPRERFFSTGEFDHYNQSSTQEFDWDGGFQTYTASIEYRALPWLAFEFQGSMMNGLEFSRPATTEFGYYQPDNSLYYRAEGGQIRPFCADPAACEYYALEYQSFAYSGSGDVGGWSAMATARLYGPMLFERVQPWISLGAGMIQISASEKGTVVESEGSRGYAFDDFDVIVPVVQEGTQPGCDPCRTVTSSYSFDNEDRALMFRVGLGAQTNLTKHLALELSAGYALPRGELKDLQSFDLGANFILRF